MGSSLSRSRKYISYQVRTALSVMSSLSVARSLQTSGFDSLIFIIDTAEMEHLPGHSIIISSFNIGSYVMSSLVHNPHTTKITIPRACFMGTSIGGGDNDRMANGGAKTDARTLM